MRDDRGGIGLEAEQAGAHFVMQLKRGEAPLVILCGNQAAVQVAVLRAKGVERLRQRVEALRDCAELLSVGAGKTHTIVASLKIAQPGCELGQRFEHPAEQEIEQ